MTPDCGLATCFDGFDQQIPMVNTALFTLSLKCQSIAVCKSPSASVIFLTSNRFSVRSINCYCNWQWRSLRRAVKINLAAEFHPAQNASLTGKNVWSSLFFCAFGVSVLLEQYLCSCFDKAILALVNMGW
jgi:hypothetical protein